jgi:hypothetical protein
LPWSASFEDPIPLPDCRLLLTLRDAASYIMKLPKAEHDAPEWQAAMERLGYRLCGELVMFEAIRRYWAEARRGDVISQQVNNILSRYRRMNRGDRYSVRSAFVAVRDELEDQFGPVGEWPLDRKKAIAGQIMKAAKTAGNNLASETTRIGASGSALLSLYLEAKALPGAKALGATEAVEQWLADES